MYLKFHESQQKQRAVYKLLLLFPFYNGVTYYFFLKLKIVKHDYLVFFQRLFATRKSNGFDLWRNWYGV